MSFMQCIVRGCETDQTRPKKMCHMHYQRHLKWTKKGVVEGSDTYWAYLQAPKNHHHGIHKGETCLTYGCESIADVARLCRTCYNRDYQRAYRKRQAEKARKYDELLMRAVLADAHEVPSGEEEAAPAPNTSDVGDLPLISAASALPYDRVLELHEAGEFDNLTLDEKIEWAKDYL